jgi:hypothetical protein
MFCAPIIIGLSNCNTETIQLTKDCKYSYSVGHLLSSTAVEHLWTCMKPHGFITGKTTLLSFTALKTSDFIQVKNICCERIRGKVYVLCIIHTLVCLLIELILVLLSRSSFTFVSVYLQFDDRFFKYDQYFFYESEIARSHCYILKLLFKKCMLSWHLLPYSTKVNKKLV